MAPVMRIEDQLRELFGPVSPDEGALLEARARDGAISARFRGAGRGDVELLLQPPGTAARCGARLPGCDVVVAGGPRVEGEGALIDRLVATLGELRTLPEEWYASLGDAAADRFLSGDTAEIKVTARCDQTCVFCKSPLSPGNLATPEEIRHALPLLARKVRSVTFSGGETTLDPNLRGHLRAARAAGFEGIEVQTNGMRLADRDRVRSLAAAGATSVLISLHAHTAGLSDRITGVSGSFPRTVRAIEHCLAEGLDVAVCHVICRANYLHVAAVADFVARRFRRRPLQLVFTLAIPIYLVRREPGMMPPLSEVGPLLREALARFVPARAGEHQARAARRAARRAAGLARVVLGAAGVGEQRIPDLRLRLARRIRRPPIHRARVRAACGIPPCVLGDMAHYHDELYVAREPRGAERMEHPECCEPCAYRRLCSGLWREYTEAHGADGIAPVIGVEPRHLRQLLLRHPLSSSMAGR